MWWIVSDKLTDNCKTISSQRVSIQSKTDISIQIFAHSSLLATRGPGDVGREVKSFS